MNDKKVNRSRNKAVTIRMNKEEFADLQAKVKESGLTQQSYLISAARGATITPSDEIEIEKEISRTFALLVQQLRGLAADVTQMAHIANTQCVLPTQEELEKTASQIQEYRRECEDIWLSIRSSINQQSHMEQ
jgi:hypothetical protein